MTCFSESGVRKDGDPLTFVCNVADLVEVTHESDVVFVIEFPPVWYLS